MLESQKVYITSTTTGLTTEFASIAKLQKATGLSSGVIYRRLRSSTKKKDVVLSVYGHKDKYTISSKPPADLVLADPAAEYIVHDGDRVYHIGSLEDCKAMKRQLGFPTLKIKLWQTTK